MTASSLRGRERIAGMQCVHLQESSCGRSQTMPAWTRGNSGLASIFLASSRKNFHSAIRSPAPGLVRRNWAPVTFRVMHKEGDVGQLAGIADAALDRALQRERPDRAAHRDRLLHICRVLARSNFPLPTRIPPLRRDDGTGRNRIRLRFVTRRAPASKISAPFMAAAQLR